MADITKATVSPSPASSAPAAQTTPAQPAPTTPTTTTPSSDADTREPRRPQVDLCWPPPIMMGLPGIAQIRPICYHFQRFGGPLKD